MFGLGIGEMLLVLALVVLFFGAKRIPEIARGMGEGIRNFRSSVKEQEDKDLLEDGGKDKRDQDQDSSS